MVGLPGDGAVVGVLGDEVAPLSAALEDAGHTAATGAPAAVLDADPAAVVAVGPAALRSLAREGPDVPVLPVAAGTGVRSVPAADAVAAVEALAAGNAERTAYPLLSVRLAGEHCAWALFDAMLVTAAPAHISEFTVSDGETAIARFRADGVVAATPAGTPEYARAAGGPVVAPGPEVVSVVPVAPFATTLEDWVLPAEGVAVTVEREEAVVELQADGRVVCEVAKGEAVSLTAAAHLDVLVVPDSGSPVAPRGPESEKL